MKDIVLYDSKNPEDILYVEPFRVLQEENIDLLVEGNENAKKVLTTIFGIKDLATELEPEREYCCNALLEKNKTTSLYFSAFKELPFDSPLDFNFIGGFRLNDKDKVVFYAVTKKSLGDCASKACFQVYKKVDKKLSSEISESIKGSLKIAKEGEFTSFSSWLTSYNVIQELRLSSLTNALNLKSSQLDLLEQDLVVHLKQKQEEKTSEYIKELKGSYISYFYNYKNYALDQPSTLSNSCMRRDSNFPSLQLYSENPETISLVVLLDKRDPYKIRARALVWTSMAGNVYHDRIYYLFEKDKIELVEYFASKNITAIYAREKQSPLFISEELQHKEVFYVRNPEILSGVGYPYLDSMNYRYHQGKESYLFLSSEAKDLYLKENKLEQYSDLPKRPDDEKRKIDSLERRGPINLMEWPFKRYIFKKDSVYISNGNKKLRTSKKVIKEFNDRYNCFKPTLLIEDGHFKTVFADKQHIVWSNFFKSYVFLNKSVWFKRASSYVPKECIKQPSFRKKVFKSFVQKTYINKLVRISPKGIEWLQELNSKFLYPIPLSGFRRSRKFFIQREFLKEEGIEIRGIIFPFKYLELVK